MVALHFATANIEEFHHDGAIWAVNYLKADITPRQQAMLEFALQVALESTTVAAADLQRLAEHGFSEEDIWDIGAIAAFFAMSNRMANLSGMRPNDEFYAMGR